MSFAQKETCIKALTRLTIAGLIVTPLMTACTTSPPDTFENYQGIVLQAHPTDQYGGGTEMTLQGDDGTVHIFGVDFRNNPPIRIVTDPNATHDTITCDVLAINYDVLSNKHSENCVVTSSNPGKFFAVGDDIRFFSSDPSSLHQYRAFRRTSERPYQGLFIRP